MGTKITDIVIVNIIREVARITRRGFGIPLVMGIHTRFSELLRTYTDIEGVAEDFQDGDEELKAATALFSQDIKPESIIIGRREANEQQQLSVSVDIVVDDTDYTVTVNSTEFIINSGVAATAITIATALVGAIVAGAEPVTPTDGLDGTFVIKSDVAGDSFGLVVDANMSITQTVVVSIDTVEDDTKYSTFINGVEFSFTSDSDATNIEIGAGLAAAITAGAEPVSVTDNLDGTYDVIANADTTFIIRTDSNQSITGDLPNKSIASELTQLQDANDTWYAIILARRATETQQLQDITQTSEWTEARIKLYLATIDQASMLTAATDDIASFLKGKAYDRTVIMYSGDEESYPEAAWAGLQLPKDPGSTTWKFKQLSGITPDDLTSTQVTNLRSKNANFFEAVAGVNIISSEAIVASGEYIDVIRGTDWLQAGIEEDVFALLVSTEKVPYTDQGIGLIENVLRAKLQDGVNVGFLVQDTVVVTVPLAADVSVADKTARELNDVEFTAQLAGAIHKVRIDGKLTL